MQHLDVCTLRCRSVRIRRSKGDKNRDSAEIKWVKKYPVTCAYSRHGSAIKSVRFAHFLSLQTGIHFFDIYAKCSVWAEWGIQEIWVKGESRRVGSNPLHTGRRRAARRENHFAPLAGHSSCLVNNEMFLSSSQNCSDLLTAFKCSTDSLWNCQMWVFSVLA